MHIMIINSDCQLNWTKTCSGRNWRNGSVVKGVCWSCRGSQCDSQHPCWGAHNGPWLRFLGMWPFWESAYPQTDIDVCTWSLKRNSQMFNETHPWVCLWRCPQRRCDCEWPEEFINPLVDLECDGVSGRWQKSGGAEVGRGRSLGNGVPDFFLHSLSLWFLASTQWRLLYITCSCCPDVPIRAWGQLTTDWNLWLYEPR